MENKTYYYLKLKENFFESDELKVLEGMENGYLYSNILLKLYLKALKNGGKLTFNDYIPYNIKMLATITGHNVDIVEKAITIFQNMHLIEILDNGTIYMLDMQKLIGSISSEGIRKQEYRNRINQEKNNNGTTLGQCPNIISISNSNIYNIYNYWNKKSIIIHRELTEKIDKAIKKALKLFSEEQIKEYIDRYNTVIKDKSYFFDYKWTLDEFLSRKDGISSFADDGSKWVSYCERSKKGASQQNYEQNKYDDKKLNDVFVDL